MKIKKFFSNEYVFSLMTKGLSILLSALHSILIARYLGASLKGVSASIQSIVSIGSIIITFGMHQAYPYFKKTYGREKIYQDYINIIFHMFALYFVIALIMDFFFIHQMEIQMAIILIPLYGFSSVMAYICLIDSPNKRNTWYSIVSIVEIVYLIMLLVFSKATYKTMFSLLLFADLLRGVVYGIMAKPHIKIFQFNRYLFAQLLRFGFLPMLALLMTTLNYKIDIIMLRSFEFITEAEIGIYSIGIAMADRIVLIPDTLKGVLVSKLSNGADEHEVAKVSRLAFIASAFVCIVFVAVGNYLIKLLYGTEYNGAYTVMVICGFGSIFIGYFKLIAQYNIVNRKQIRNVVLLSGSVLLNMVLNYILIPKYRLSGAALASGIGYLVSGWIFILWFSKTNGIKMQEMFVIQKKDLQLLKSLFNRKK